MEYIKGNCKCKSVGLVGYLSRGPLTRVLSVYLYVTFQIYYILSKSSCNIYFCDLFFYVGIFFVCSYNWY